MKIYIAASFDQQDEMRLLAGQIEAWTKHIVVSRWHGNGREPAFSPRLHYAEVSRLDVEDIKSADILVSVSGRSTSGGRHVEFGLAWAWNLKVIILGERENLFNWLPGVWAVPNRGALFDLLREKFVNEKTDLVPDPEPLV